MRHPCQRCGGTGERLHRTNIVPGEGSIQAPLMFIGEAPGGSEDLHGSPFWFEAPAGRVLRKALRDLELEDCYITNVVKCRPPDNELKYYPDAIVKCRKYLDEEIKEVQPRVIVTLGATAGKLWLPGGATQQAQLARATGDFVVVGSIHPAYVARGSDREAEHMFYSSLKRAKELLKEMR